MKREADKLTNQAKHARLTTARLNPEAENAEDTTTQPTHQQENQAEEIQHQPTNQLETPPEGTPTPPPGTQNLLSTNFYNLGGNQGTPSEIDSTRINVGFFSQQQNNLEGEGANYFPSPVIPTIGGNIPFFRIVDFLDAGAGANFLANAYSIYPLNQAPAPAVHRQLAAGNNAHVVEDEGTNNLEQSPTPSSEQSPEDVISNLGDTSDLSNDTPEV